MEYEQAVLALSGAGRWIAEHHMTWGSAGNISVRLDERRVVITGSGTRFDSLTADSFSLYDLETDTWTGRKPSKELPVHLAIYRRSPWAGAVLHASPFHTTLAASSSLEVRNDLFVENMYYLQRVARIPYAHPGSAELTAAVENTAAAANVILMENHGVILYDTSLAECTACLEVLENTCRMCLEAARAGITLQPVSPDTVRDFLLNSGYKPPRPWRD